MSSPIPEHSPGVSRPRVRGDILDDRHFNGRKEGTLTERQVKPKTQIPGTPDATA